MQAAVGICYACQPGLHSPFFANSPLTLHWDTASSVFKPQGLWAASTQLQGAGTRLGLSWGDGMVQSWNVTRECQCWTGLKLWGRWHFLSAGVASLVLLVVIFVTMWGRLAENEGKIERG